MQAADRFPTREHHACCLLGGLIKKASRESKIKTTLWTLVIGLKGYVILRISIQDCPSTTSLLDCTKKCSFADRKFVWDSSLRSEWKPSKNNCSLISDIFSLRQYFNRITSLILLNYHAAQKWSNCKQIRHNCSSCM